MIGFYFIQNKYRFVNGNERNENDKYSKEMTSQPAANIRMKESFDTEENENENCTSNANEDRYAITV
jgi:hypothetical protein